MLEQLQLLVWQLRVQRTDRALQVLPVVWVVAGRQAG